MGTGEIEWSKRCGFGGSPFYVEHDNSPVTKKAKLEGGGTNHCDRGMSPY